VAAEHAAAAGLEVWFAPFPCELDAAGMAPLLAECADRAEHLRQSGAEVVLVTGCELSLFATGFLPGATVFDRIARLQVPDQELMAAFGVLPGRLAGFLGQAAQDARARFGGRLTYASGLWEPVDWAAFDIVSVDAYRDADNSADFAAGLRERVSLGKPLAVTEFGCCAYAGAADRGGLGWAIVDLAARPRRLDGDYRRDEAEQVRYLRELVAVFAAEGVDTAFWFTFAGYEFPHHDGPRADLDLASYGVVRMRPDGPGPGHGHEGLGWEPKLAFQALAEPWPGEHAG
jgi:hypothetical protein